MPQTKLNHPMQHIHVALASDPLQTLVQHFPPYIMNSEKDITSVYLTAVSQHPGLPRPATDAKPMFIPSLNWAAFGQAFRRFQICP